MDDIVDIAELGEESRVFLQGRLYERLSRLALEQRQAADEALEEVDPFDGRKVADLQQQARFGKAFEGWLRQLVIEGDAALDQFRRKEE